VDQVRDLFDPSGERGGVGEVADPNGRLPATLAASSGGTPTFMRIRCAVSASASAVASLDIAQGRRPVEARAASPRGWIAASPIVATFPPWLTLPAHDLTECALIALIALVVADGHAPRGPCTRAGPVVEQREWNAA
jgi:hypothetical protein